MILDCILTAVNENPLYLDFVPIFIKTWNKLYPKIDVKVILISNEIPHNLLEFKDNIILFEPIENIITSFTAQYIRLLYPCILNYKNGVMITDIDMMPMNRTYYTDNIKEYSDDKFIYLRGNILFSNKQIAICYNVATPRVWKEIFNINSLEDIKNNIEYIYENNIIKEGRNNIGWCTDQLILYEKVMSWNAKTNNLICLNENKTGFKRLDRNTFSIKNQVIRKKITNGLYTDYHCYRPMNKYSAINYEIYNLL